MTYSINWHSEEKRIIVIEFVDALTWTEFHEAVSHAHSLIKNRVHRVDLIIWDKAGLPVGNALLHFRRAFRTQPDNVDRVVIVPLPISSALANTMRHLASIMMNLFPSHSRISFADSLQEALTKLREAT